MPLFETSRAAALTPGPHIIDIAAPNVIDGVAQRNRVGIALQSEWGPVKEAYAPASAADFVQTYFPGGCPRTSSGWLAVTRRRKVPWTIVRVLGGAAGILPPGPPTIAPQTPSTKTYKYVVVANNATGATQAGAWAITTTGDDDLSGVSKGNVVTWTAVTGATSYDLYRTYAGGAVTNAVGKVAASIAGTTYTDVGALATPAATPPTANTTGYTQAVTDLYTSSTATSANSTAGAAVVRLIWAYPGTLPNTAGSVTTAAATNGDSDAFDLTVTITDSVTGLTSEKYLNLKDITTVALPTNQNGGRSTSSPATLTDSYLLDQVLLLGTPTARPANATWTPLGGANGSAIVASDYEAAWDALDRETDVMVYVTDNCGDSIRATVNTDLTTHVTAMTDRFGILTCNLADAWATVKGASGAGVGVNRSKYIRYTSWVNVLDVNGVEQASPFATFLASLTSQLDAREPDAWRRKENQEYLRGISSLYTTVWNPMDASVQTDATTLGVAIPIKLASGGYAALHDRTTSLSVAERFAMVQKIRRQWALDLSVGLEPWTNGPNDEPEQREANRAVVTYMQGQARLRRVATATAALLAEYPDFAAAGVAVGQPMFFTNITTPNTAQSVAAGEFAIALNAITPSVMEKIFVLFNVGTTISTTG